MSVLLAGVVGGLIGCCLAGGKSTHTVKHIHHYHREQEQKPIKTRPYFDTKVVVTEIPEDLTLEEKVQGVLNRYNHQPFTELVLRSMWEDIIAISTCHPELEFPVICHATPNIKAEFYIDKCWVYTPYKDEPEMYER